jgi:GT2 family glycosyltransferase/glycosyltransferase involved in cell wall biosynthesis
MLAVAQRFPVVAEDSRHEVMLPDETATAVACVATGQVQRPTTSGLRPIDVVIPVYRGLDTTLACIVSVLAHREVGERVIVVSDGVPDLRLVAALSSIADRGEIVLKVEATNRGFPGAANIGLRMTAGRDVVLLNADTVVTPGWLSRLLDAVHSAPDIGTATPFSNDATIFSYPKRDVRNPCPDAAVAARLAIMANEANQGKIVDVPTGHGFCLYVRAECLAETGVLRDDLFAQGYGEENDFCMRARHLGWRHVAVPGVYVAHQGAVSFNGARDDLIRRNSKILNRLHVGYDAMIAEWSQNDPLAESRRRLDWARLQSAVLEQDTVLIIMHGRDGGARDHAAERLDVITKAGKRALLLLPDPGDWSGVPASQATCKVRLDLGFEGQYPNLLFGMPDERAELLACLRACRVSEIEVHSLIGHGGSVAQLIVDLQVPFHVVVHDYSWFCPRVSLMGGNDRYCGEPSIATCRDCIADHGADPDVTLSPDALVDRSQHLIGAARSVIAPSRDTAARIERHFGREVVCAHWEQAHPLVLRNVSRQAGNVRPVRVCVVGAIGYEKGYSNLLRCARIVAAKKLPIEFVVVGYSCDDRRLLDTGVVRITGKYLREESTELIKAQAADIAWLPALCPETWCYVLTEIWQAGLYVVVHDIGAQAERVRDTDGGLVVPIDLLPEQLLQVFLDPSLVWSGRRPNQSMSSNRTA